MITKVIGTYEEPIGVKIDTDNVGLAKDATVNALLQKFSNPKRINASASVDAISSVTLIDTGALSSPIYVKYVNARFAYDNMGIKVYIYDKTGTAVEVGDTIYDFYQTSGSVRFYGAIKVANYELDNNSVVLELNCKCYGIKVAVYNGNSSAYNAYVNVLYLEE